MVLDLATVRALIQNVVILLVTLLIIVIIIVPEPLRRLHFLLILVVKIRHIPIILVKEVILVLDRTVQVGRIHGYLLLANLLVAGIITEAMVHHAHAIGRIGWVMVVVRVIVFVSTLTLLLLLIKDDHLVRPVLRDDVL